MKERPILMSGEMVRAILEARKSQTRRIMKPQPRMSYDQSFYYPTFSHPMKENERHYVDEAHFRKGVALDFAPYGQPGDRLWVREAWNHFPNDVLEATDEGRRAFKLPWYGNKKHFSVVYRADTNPAGTTWKPSIHMPRWASRITLEITDVRVERLQDISEEDAHAEGAPCLSGIASHYHGDCSWSMKGHFEQLWESINGPGSWERNDWVWVIEFKKVMREENHGGNATEV